MTTAKAYFVGISGTLSDRETVIAEVYQVELPPAGDATDTACQKLGIIEIASNLEAVGLPLFGQPYKDQSAGGDPVRSPSGCDKAYDWTFVRSYNFADVTEVNSRNPNYREQLVCARQVTVNYSQNDPSNPQNEQDERPPGESSNDPDAWRPTIRSNSVERLRQQEFLKFKGLWQADTADCSGFIGVPDLQPIENPCLKLAIGECTRPQTTAGEPYAVLPDLEDTDWVHTITMYKKVGAQLESIDQFRAYVRSVNNSQQTYDITARGVRLTLPAWTARLRSVTLEIKEHTYNDGTTGDRKREQFYQWGFEIVDRAEGWDLDIVNAGFEFCSAPGEPDGQGGNHDGGATPCPDGTSGCTQGAEQADNTTPTTAIKDKAGNTASAPQPLDNLGRTIRVSGQTVDPNTQPYFNRYEGRPGTDWNQIPLLKTLKTTQTQAVQLINQVNALSLAALGGGSGGPPTSRGAKVADISYLQGTLTLTGADAAFFDANRLAAGGRELWLSKGVTLTVSQVLNVTVNRDDTAGGTGTDNASMSVTINA